MIFLKTILQKKMMILVLYPSNWSKGQPLGRSSQKTESFHKIFHTAYGIHSKTQK